jgi:hypothetical protein
MKYHVRDCAPASDEASEQKSGRAIQADLDIVHPG